MTDRLTALEERVSHLLRAIDDLSDTVHAQDRRIDVLERRVRALMEREAEREAAEGTPPVADQPPPHW